MPPSLADLSLGFRRAYLDDERLTAQLRAWVEAYPTLCRLTSIATTPEGRDVWLLTIGPEPDRRPPGGVGRRQHARGRARGLERRARDRRGRRSGSTSSPTRSTCPTPIARAAARRAVLRRAADVARRRRGRAADRAHAALACRATAASSAAARAGSSATSTATASRWRCACRDPGGELVEAREFPGLLVERTLEDEGPFYKLYPEGTIEHFDGKRDPVAVLPRRQPDRSQPQLPVVVGARATSRSAPARSRRASPRRAASSSSRPRTPRSSRGSTSTRSAAC